MNIRSGTWLLVSDLRLKSNRGYNNDINSNNNNNNDNSNKDNKNSKRNSLSDDLSKLINQEKPFSDIAFIIEDEDRISFAHKVR